MIYKKVREAERAIQLMKHTYKSIVEREKKCHGIIIKEADMVLYQHMLEKIKV